MPTSYSSKRRPPKNILAPTSLHDPYGNNANKSKPRQRPWASTNNNTTTSNQEEQRQPSIKQKWKAGGLRVSRNYLGRGVSKPKPFLSYNDQIKLWQAAVEANEEDKSSIFDDSGSQSEFVPEMLLSETFGPSQNYSLSAGNSIEHMSRSIETETTLNTINFTIDGQVLYEIGGYVNGFGTVYNSVIPITFEVEKNTTNTENSYMGFGYVLSNCVV